VKLKGNHPHFSDDGLGKKFIFYPSKVHPVRPRGGAKVQLYSFFTLGARYGWVVNAMHWPLHPWE